jgi:hypothetical protein
VIQVAYVLSALRNKVKFAFGVQKRDAKTFPVALFVQAIKTKAHKNEEDAVAQLAEFVAELETLKRKKLRREEEVRRRAQGSATDL